MKPVTLPPVRTREDCHAWLSQRDVDAELWAAFMGARAWVNHDDFELEALAFDSEYGGGHELMAGTVIDKFDGKPWVTRESYLENLIWFMTLRLRALGERYGVNVNPENLPLLPPGSRTASEALQHPFWGKWAGVKVTTITDADIAKMGPKDRELVEAAIRAGKESGKGVGSSISAKKRTPAGAANTSGAMTINKRSIDDGTDCKS